MGAAEGVDIGNEQGSAQGSVRSMEVLAGRDGGASAREVERCSQTIRGDGDSGSSWAALESLDLDADSNRGRKLGEVEVRQDLQG